MKAHSNSHGHTARIWMIRRVFDNHALLEMANKLTAHQLPTVIQTSGIASVNGMRYSFSRFFRYFKLERILIC